jgi:hypothetical protein
MERNYYQAMAREYYSQDDPRFPDDEDDNEDMELSIAFLDDEALEMCTELFHISSYQFIAEEISD